MTTLSTIGQGTKIRGSIRGDGDLDVHGYVEGTVSVQGDLTIGETALIKSDISGRRVTVRGAIAGNVSAEEVIVIEAGARVAGDIGAPQIGIRPGALVRGNVATGAPLPPGGLAPRARPQAAPAARPAAREPARAPVAPARPAPRAPQAPPRAVHTPAPAPAAHAAPAAAAPPPKPSAPAIEVPPRDDLLVDAADLDDAAGGPPPPVVPSIAKGAKASLRRKGAR